MPTAVRNPAASPDPAPMASKPTVATDTGSGSGSGSSSGAGAGSGSNLRTPSAIAAPLKAVRGKRKRKTKKPRDPNAPKRALSSYMLFAAATRADIRKANPEMGTTEVARALGAAWRALSDEDKAVRVV